MFRIEFDGQVVGPYDAAEAWDVMNEVFKTGANVTLVNMDTGSRIVASHTEV